MNLSGYVRHVTIFSWMFAIACFLVVALGLGLGSVEKQREVWGGWTPHSHPGPPLNGRLNCVRSVGHGSACERRLSLWPMPYVSLACDMTSASEVAVAAWGALQVLYAFAFATHEIVTEPMKNIRVLGGTPPHYACRTVPWTPQGPPLQTPRCALQPLQNIRPRHWIRFSVWLVGCYAHVLCDVGL